MEWLQSLKTVLNEIEENLCGDISITKLADKVYMSPYYLQRGFQIVTGYSIGEYIRNRRMYEAAKVLSATDKKVIEIAYDFGYETPESFTKAFTRFHGASPLSVRKTPESIRSFLPVNIKIEITGGNYMDCKITPLWGFKIIGFERIFDYETAYSEIPEFWNEICEKYCTHTIYAGLDPSCPEEQAIMDNCIGEYGVCIDDVGEGKFRYLIAGRYTGGDVPKSMKTFEFPKGEWAKFECVGPVPQSLQSLNDYVFKQWLPGNPDYEMSGYYNVEWYSCDGEKSDSDYKSGIWVPVKRYSDEVKKRFGNTDEYKQSAIKAAARTDEQNSAVNAGLMDIFAEFGGIKNMPTGSSTVNGMVLKLKNYIGKNYYDCSDQMLFSLGEMYVNDNRFKQNIDRVGGENTAQFVHDAIAKYLEK